MLADDPDDRTLDPSENSLSNSSEASSSAGGETLGTSTGYTPSPDPSFTVPRPVGPYRFVRKLGEGGMGQVY